MIAGVCGALLFIVMFLGWFGAPEIEGAEEAAAQLGIEVPDATANAWEAFDFIDIILAVTVIVAVGGAIATAMARDVALPVAVSALTAGLGILSVVLILFRIIDTPYDLDREIWVFVGLVLAGGIAYGGWMDMQEEGTSFGDQVDRVQRDDQAPPPPPPAATPPPGSQGPAA